MIYLLIGLWIFNGIVAIVFGEVSVFSYLCCIFCLILEYIEDLVGGQ